MTWRAKSNLRSMYECHPCETCGAAPGATCRTHTGRDEPCWPHAARVRAAKAHEVHCAECGSVSGHAIGCSQGSLAGWGAMTAPQECPVCGARGDEPCISMAKRYLGDYGCRGRATSLAVERRRERKTPHRERLIEASAPEDTRPITRSHGGARPGARRTT